jgi:Spy/CpxP family protein refolding chaperone
MHHPGFWWWWGARREGHPEGHEAHADVHVDCGPGGEGRHWRRRVRVEWDGPGGGFGFGDGEPGPGPGGFGVRRPLRFLAWKLDLDDAQMREVARALDDLKTERAQAAVDARRSAAALADALTEEKFDAAKTADAASPRVQSAERMKQATVRALERVHKVLRPEQRETLAMLVRTGVVQI